MPLNDEVQTLRSVPLFAGVPSTKLKLLAFNSHRVNFLQGEVLFRQGDEGDAAYVILSGQASVLVDSPNGKIAVAKVSKNAIVGEISILCDHTRTATVQAETPLNALRIGKEQFMELLADFPEVTIEVVRVLARRLSQTTSELTATRERDINNEGCEGDKPKRGP